MCNIKKKNIKKYYKMIKIPYTEIMNIFNILQVELNNILQR